MAFAKKKMFAKLVADGNSDMLILVLKTTTPTVLAGGITTSAGGGAVNVTACKYMVGSKVSIAPAVAALAITTTNSLAVRVSDNTIVEVAAASIAAAVAAGTHLELASATHAGGAVTPTLKRRLLEVAVTV